MHVICPTHLTLFNLIILIISGKVYEVPHYATLSSFLPHNFKSSITSTFMIPATVGLTGHLLEMPEYNCWHFPVAPLPQVQDVYCLLGTATPCIWLVPALQ